jgi:hypothetical protein
LPAPDGTNPFPFLMLAVLDVRVQLEALQRTLTYVSRLTQEAQLGQPRIRRDDFATEMGKHCEDILRHAETLTGPLDTLCAEARVLAERVARGEDLTHFDVWAPWERRAAPRSPAERN